uniref:Uncharacterized protein n=1 Tax=Meloidogyne incognita TaxID=6306 RepID=A0A914NBZ0_MELIC
METEILQMLNDTLDDYNILRRDNLLAELVINFARVHLRIATDKASKQENNENQQHQKINLLMLTFDLDQLNGRIQISPKEHRTEMSINVGDLSIQQMQQQQQHFINNSEERKKDSNNLSKNNNDESLFCGFQEDILSNSDITTNLLFTIGRRNENTTKNKNFSSPIVELFYKRLAPKMEIYHELNICCAPLAMLADDCFIATLREIVGRVEENNKSFQHSTPSTSNFSTTFKSSDESSLIFHQIFISATIPELLIELRSQKAAQDCILSTLPKHREEQNNKKRTRRKRTSNSILFPLNFDINDVCNNVGGEEFNVEGNNSEHQKNTTTTNDKNNQNLKQTSIKTGKYEHNINKNKNTTNTTTKTFSKNKLVFTPTTTTISNEHSNFATIETSSSSFVLASVCGLSFTFIKKHLQQQKLNKINVGFDSFNLKDLFEKTTNKDSDFLLKIGKEKAVSPNKNGPDGTTRSLSCPDLTTNNGSKHLNNSNNISPNKTTENSDFSSNLASTSLLNENLFVGETENNVCNRHQTMPTTKQQQQQVDNIVSNIKQNQKKKHCIEVVFVPNKHEEVETSCKKANCIVTGNFDDEQTNVELFINRRTWLLLIDFFGFCSTSDINNKNVLDNNNNNNYIMNIELNISSNLILSMNYPKSELTPKLGIAYIQKPTFTVQ